MSNCCIKHGDFELSHICLDCRQVMCISCVIEHSNRHKIMALVELATDVIQRFCREYDESSKIATEMNQLRTRIRQRVADYWDALKRRICTTLDDYKMDSLKLVEGILGKRERFHKPSPTVKDQLIALFKKKQYYEIYKRKGSAQIVSQWIEEQARRRELLATMYNNIPSNSVSLSFVENVFLKMEQNLYSAIDSICNANYGAFFEESTMSLLYIPSYSKALPLAQRVLNPALVQAKSNIYLIGGNLGKWDQAHLNTTYVFSSVGGLSSSSLQPKAKLNAARAWHGVAAVQDALIYAVGGFNNVEGTLSSCERYVVAQDRWIVLPSLLYKRWGLSVTTFDERFVYAFLGVDGKVLCAAIEMLDTCDEDRGWANVYQPDYQHQHMRRCHGSFQASNSEILVFGGDTGVQQQNKCLLYSTYKRRVSYTPNDFACHPHPSYYRCPERTHASAIYKLAVGSQAAAYNMIYKAWIVFELCALKSPK